jgi:hypothetical protein
MIRRMKGVALLAGLLVFTCAQAQDFGRLFFTPEERAALDARRRARLPDKPAAAPAVAAPVTRVDGYVRRSEGPSTVWVNGGRVEEAAPGSDARVSIPLGQGAGRVRLKPGETLDRGTGEVRDVLGPRGEIKVQPAK